MKVVLIYPGEYSKSDTGEEEFKLLQNYHMPLGILYLGQVLKDSGHKVFLYDHNITGVPIKSILAWLKKVDPDVLGFTVLSANLPTVNNIAKQMKEWNPNLIIVYGGYAATFCAQDIVKHYDFVDFCVRGEGELTITDLLETLEKNRPLSNVLGISYRDNGKMVENLDRPLIHDLDTIPIPDRKLFHQHYEYSGKSTTMISSRGCPYRCRFCSCRAFARDKWRLRSIENIIEEMLYLKAAGFKEILFTDDCFNANSKRTLKLCHSMMKEKLDFAWHAVGRINQSEVRFLRTMEKSGCKSLVYGVESANQRILDYYAKMVTPAMAVTAIKNSKKAGIDYIGAGFIIGAPIETRDEVVNTIKFGLKLQRYGLTNTQFQILFVSPGTDLYREFVEKGYIDPVKDWGKELPAVDIVPNSLDREYLETMAKRGFKDFVTNKRYMISQYLKSARSIYRLRVVYHFLQKRKLD
ncbi:MAG: radical SAM protein [Candidatus Helarchaeota archaeon]|nr:radical SAM protein [Candidatus Helarchaeota archaeon]